VSKSKPKTALAVRAPEPEPGPVAMFERLAKDKNVDVEKLERLIAMQERILAVNAKAAFDAAFAVMAPLIPEVERNGTIRNKQGEVQSKYPKNEDIQQVIRPILASHGFALSFQTKWPEPGKVLVIGILTHREGHSRESHFLSSADTSGNKNDIQALGSTVSYGRRYATMDLLNITSRGADRDGQAMPSRRRESGGQPTPPAAPSRDPSAGEPITDKQRRRLWVIIKNAGRSETEVKAWLAVAYNIDSTKKITRGTYDAICTAIERPGLLPRPPAREPGEDDE
jgi:ERF superfamily